MRKLLTLSLTLSALVLLPHVALAQAQESDVAAV